MKHRLLIVDDEEAILYALSEFFIAHGYEVDTASSVVQAQEFLDSQTYCVLLADLRLGDWDGCEGLDLIARVRRNSPHTSSILLTAFGTAEVRAKARECGAWVIDKPVALHDLNAQVDVALLAAKGCME